MMKRFIFACIALCMAASSAQADEQKDITLSDDHKEEMVALPSLCNLFVSLTVNDEESGTLRLLIENTDEEHTLLLFGSEYNEKYLKGQYPKITYHKIFGGTKGKRTTDCNRGFDDIRREGIKKVEPSDKKNLLTTSVRNGELQTIRIPIYIAKYKGKKRNKMELMEKQVVELNVRVNLKPDEEFVKLSSDIDQFVRRLEQKPFCTHKLHKKSLKEQKQPYEDERTAMLEKIRSIREAHHWFSTDRAFKKYESLRTTLEEIDLSDYETANCGKASEHKTPVAPKPVVRTAHKCKYCSYSLAQKYDKLDRYSKQLYNGKVTKSGIMGDVQTLYNCCTHSSEWQSGGAYKSRIEDLYKRISSR